MHIQCLLESTSVRNMILAEAGYLLEDRADLPAEFQRMEFVTKGNLKLGQDTWIMNMSSATECPSRKLGLCQVSNCGKKCYAINAEKGYLPGVLPFRTRQNKEFHGLTAEEIFDDLMDKFDRKRIHPVYLRISESGDFSGQEDVEKVSELSDLLKGKMKVYNYTARRDLNFHNVSENLTVNGSIFTSEEAKLTGVHNVFKALSVEEYNKKFPVFGPGGTIDGPIVYNEFGDEEYKCMGDCRICKICTYRHGKVTYVKAH